MQDIYVVLGSSQHCDTTFCTSRLPLPVPTPVLHDRAGDENEADRKNYVRRNISWRARKKSTGIPRSCSRHSGQLPSQLLSECLGKLQRASCFVIELRFVFLDLQCSSYWSPMPASPFSVLKMAVSGGKARLPAMEGQGPRKVALVSGQVLAEWLQSWCTRIRRFACAMAFSLLGSCLRTSAIHPYVQARLPSLLPYPSRKQRLLQSASGRNSRCLIKDLIDWYEL